MNKVYYGNQTHYNSLAHYGIKGMKWGETHEKDYVSTSWKAHRAAKANAKTDAGFKRWKEEDAKKKNAIDLGIKANEAKRTWEADKSNKDNKSAYKSANKDYKKALKSNTLYRQGSVREEVGKEQARKTLSEAKKVKKQLDADPTNKDLKKEYNRLMSEHDIERADARRAQEVGAKRSQAVANVKRTATMTAKAAAGTAVVAGGLYAANKILQSKGYPGFTFNAPVVKDNIKKGINVLKNLKGFMY